jgi:signal transduction histidine kinase
MIWRSTTVRFAALVFLLQMLAAAALLVTIGVILRGQIAADAAAAADTLRNDLLATYRDGGLPALRKTLDDRPNAIVRRGAVVLLVDRNGRALGGNLAEWPPGIALGDRYTDLHLYRVRHVEPEAMRVRATRLAGGARLLTGRVVESQREVLLQLERATLLALALALVFAALAAWLTARMVEQRLGATVAALGAVRGGDLARRVPHDPSGDAFATLGREVNHTLDRLYSLVDGLKLTTAGLAHDLKSPLTRQRVALERAAAAVLEPAAQEPIDQALLEGERILAIVEIALSIARAEAGLGRETFVETDLSELLETIAEIYAPLAEDHGREIEVDAAPLRMAVHRDLLGQALSNLIENSLKYGAGTIRLSLTPRFQRASLSVADQGPGIPEHLHADALRRFGRLDAARSGSGAGLGLSLVAAVAKLHDGTIALSDAQPGLVVTIDIA